MLSKLTKVYVHKDYVTETDKAIGLTIKRKDNIQLPNKVYFPKSQCKLTKGYIWTISIPKWLWDTKLPYGEQIVTGI